MEEQLIIFDTAKLAKEKGFNYDMGWNEYYYDPLNNNEIIHGSDKNYPNELNKEDYASQTAAQIEFDKWEKKLISAPTQSLLQKWLREVHGINVMVNTDGTLSWIWTIQSLHPEASYKGVYIKSDFVFSTYEEAFEAGLQKALNLIES